MVNTCLDEGSWYLVAVKYLGKLYLKSAIQILKLVRNYLHEGYQYLAATNFFGKYT